MLLHPGHGSPRSNLESRSEIVQQLKVPEINLPTYVGAVGGASSGEGEEVLFLIRFAMSGHTGYLTSIPILAKLSRLEEENEAKNTARHKAQLQPDRKQQRSMIIHAVSAKFVKRAIDEYKEKTKSGGGDVRLGWQFAGGGRPQTAPASMLSSLNNNSPLPSLYREESIPRPQTSWGSKLAKAQIVQDRPASALRREFAQMLSCPVPAPAAASSLSSSSAKSGVRAGQTEYPEQLERGITQQMLLEARSSKKIFDSIRCQLPRCVGYTVFLEKSKSPPNMDDLVELGPQQDLSEQNQQPEQQPLIISVHGSNPSTAAQKLSRSASAPVQPVLTIRSAFLRSPSSPPQSPGKSHSKHLAGSAKAVKTAKPQGLAIIVDPAVTMQRMEAHLQLSYFEIAGEPASETKVTVKISTTGRPPFELDLTTVEGDFDQTGSARILGGTNEGGRAKRTVYVSSVPGWAGQPPIFIPATSCSCRLIQDRSWTVPGTDGKPGTGTISLALCAFPVTSQTNALMILNKYVNETLTKQLANVFVPGGVPALHVAALHGNQEALRRLVDSGADVNFRDPRTSSTALHAAIDGGHSSVASFLLENGAIQTYTDEFGENPLHRAVKHNDISCVRILMKAEGAARALAKKNKKGLRPIDLSSSKFMFAQIEARMVALKIMAKSKAQLFRS